MSSGSNGHLRCTTPVARVMGVLIVALLLVVLLMPVGLISAQQKGAPREEPTPESMATPGSRLVIDESSLGTLRDVLKPTGGIPAQILNEEFGYTIDYLEPWQSNGTSHGNGMASELLVDPEADAWLSITSWPWPSDSTVRDTIWWWASPEEVANWMPGGEVLQMTSDATAGSVVYLLPSTPDYPWDWVYVSELHVYDGYAVEVLFWSEASVFAEAYTSAGEAVMVNATPAVGVYLVNEIEAALPAE